MSRLNACNDWLTKGVSRGLSGSQHAPTPEFADPLQIVLGHDLCMLNAMTESGISCSCVQKRLFESIEDFAVGAVLYQLPS